MKLRYLTLLWIAQLVYSPVLHSEEVVSAPEASKAAEEKPRIAAPATGPREVIDRIVATVDAKPILASRLQEKINADGLVLEISDYPADEKADNITRALNDEINAILVKRKIKDLDLQVTSEQIEQQIQRMLKERNTTMEQLEGYLKSHGKTLAKYKEDMKNQMLTYQFRGRVLMPLVRSIQKSGRDSRNRNREALEVSMKKIVNKSKDVILEAHKALQKDTPFDKAQKLYSESTAGRAKDTVEPAIKYKVSDLLPGIKAAVLKVPASSERQFTEPIETPMGWLIFQIEKREYAAEAPTSAEDRHADEQLLLEQQLKIWLKNERDKVKIEIISASKK